MPTNRYIDTRGYCENPATFTEAVVEGLADGGGLFVPETLPHFSLEEIISLAKLPYAKRAAKIYSAFNIDIDDETISSLMEQAYGEQFDSEDICPITSLDNKTHILELWHGPTSAFKDMALQCLPLFFAESASRLREAGSIHHNFLILVATSGDTGKAALEGFKDKEGVKIAVLYPHGGVSDIQYKQMATQAGNNVEVWSVKGNFDDCQTGVKSVFNDEDFNGKLLADYQFALSSANSINWGRLLPQIVYYISSYGKLVNDGKLSAGEPLDVCVPTGNFGNILAAWYAKQMGTPLGKLFCASNENRVLTDFISTGEYSIANRPFVLTPSPSMDILISSNMERQLFELTGRDGETISKWMKNLKETGSFKIDSTTLEKLQADFASDSVDNATCLETIGRVLKDYNYLVDPHTAVAIKATQNLRGENQVLIASTAHWAKFGENVYRGIHDIAPKDPLPAEVSALSGCELNELIANETNNHNIPQGLAELDSKDIRFKEVIDNSVESIETAVNSFLSK